MKRIIKLIDLKINNLEEQIRTLEKKKEYLLDTTNFKKEYTSKQALSFLKSGKIMAISKGHMHTTGYFYDYKDNKIREHNGDGSIYNNNIDEKRILQMFKSPLKKNWVIVTKEDLINVYNCKEGYEL